MTIPKKLKKVKIDDRFKAALKSKEFNLVQKVDKRGKRVDKQDTTMANFYQLEDDDNQDQVEPRAKGVENKYYDEEGKFKWDAQSSSEEEDDEHDDEEEDQQEIQHFQQDDDEDNVWD